jgi:hypothetical protein
VLGNKEKTMKTFPEINGMNRRDLTEAIKLGRINHDSVKPEFQADLRDRLAAMEERIMPEDIKTHYDAVMGDLQKRRDALYQEISERQARLKELQNTIASIARLTNPSSNAQTITQTATGPKYSNLGVRWAILDLLGESGPMATSDVAEVLKREGVVSQAANFTNNVSAVLSTTMKGKGEVQQTVDGKWELTDAGKNSRCQDGEWRT